MEISKPKDARQICFVSVVIPCLNEASSITRLLNAVAAQDYPLHQVIVVDCGSADGTLETLEQYQREHPAFPLNFFVQCRGTIPRAMNAGIRTATGEIIIRLDAHSCPINAYIRQSVETLLATGAGVAGGVWKIAPGSTGVTARAIARAVAHPLGAGDAAYRIGPPRPGRSQVDTVPYGCYRKSTWEKIGGYNEKLQTNEDYEFNYRVRLGGQPVLLDSDIRCTYIARSNLSALAKQYFRYGWWKAKMLLKHPGSLRLRQAIPVGFVTVIVALVGASVLFEWARWLLGSILLLYVLVLSTTSLSIGWKAGDWGIVPILPSVFATVHFAWGSGMLTHLASLGRWPTWRQ
jgi:succinoglycan biosynthesis protein ExoA